jgi:hypothetical protein
MTTISKNSTSAEVGRGELEKVKNNSSQLQDTPVVPVVVVAVTFFVTNGAATSTHNVA